MFFSFLFGMAHFMSHLACVIIARHAYTHVYREVQDKSLKFSLCSRSTV